MVIKNKSRSLIIETLIKKKQANKVLKHVQSVVTEKQKDERNDKELNVDLSIKTSTTTSSTISSPSIASKKNNHTLNTNQSSPRVSASAEKSQRKALRLKKIPHLPKSSPNKKKNCDKDDEDPKALPILKSVNSSSTLSSGVSRREKMSRAMKAIDLHRRRNKSLRDGEIVSRSSIDSFVQDTSVSSSFASVPSSTTPLCILSDLTKVSDTTKNDTDATGTRSPESAQRYRGDSRAHQIPQVGSEYNSTPEHKRYLVVPKTSGKNLENSRYSSFPRNSTNRSVKEPGNFPNNDEYSVKGGGVNVVSVGEPIRHTKDTNGRTHDKFSSKVQTTSKITGTPLLGQDKPSLDPHSVNVQTKSKGEKPILLNCQSVQSISNLQIKDNFESTSLLNPQASGRGKANVPKDTKQMNPRDELSKSESTIGSEKSLIVDTYLSMPTHKTSPVNIENIVGRSLSYEVTIVGSNNGFETEYKNYLDDLDHSGHLSVLNLSDSTECMRNSRSYSTTYTESKTLNSFCSISESRSDDDRTKYTSNNRRTGSKSARDYKKPSISLPNESDSTLYSTSHDDSMTLYEDDEDDSQTIYSHRSRDKNENSFFSSWCN